MPPPPVQAQAPSTARLNDSLEIIRQEFELVAGDLGVLRGQRDEFEARSEPSAFLAVVPSLIGSSPCSDKRT